MKMTTEHTSRNVPVGGGKGDERVESKITFNWEGVTEEELQELAALQAKTRLQNERRVNKLPIEDGEVIKVKTLCLHQGRKAKEPMTTAGAIKVLQGNGMTLEEIISMLQAQANGEK